MKRIYTDELSFHKAKLGRIKPIHSAFPPEAIELTASCILEQVRMIQVKVQVTTVRQCRFPAPGGSGYLNEMTRFNTGLIVVAGKYLVQRKRSGAYSGC